MKTKILKSRQNYFLKSKAILVKICLLLVFVGVCFSDVHATGELIDDIFVRGNGRVESDAILTIIKSRRGDKLSEAVVRDDMQLLFDLGYFSDLRFFKKATAKGVVLVIQVSEKPAITSISYDG